MGKITSNPDRSLAKKSSSIVSPRLVGVGVVVAVMVIPGVPTAYLIPGAIFLGALGVYLAEARQQGRRKG